MLGYRLGDLPEEVTWRVAKERAGRLNESPAIPGLAD